MVYRGPAGWQKTGSNTISPRPSSNPPNIIADVTADDINLGDDDTHDYEVVRVSVTPNGDGTYTVACNTKHTGYDDTVAAKTQKDEFEQSLRGVHSKIEADLPAPASENMEVRPGEGAA